MDKSFFCQWFKGFESGLEELDVDSRSRLLSHCARRCADTGILQAHLKLYQAVNGDRDAFYSRLSETGDVRGEIVVPNKEYFIYFPKCACDIHTDFGVDSANLCECSRQSIMYVAASVWHDSKIQVEQIETILSGDSQCKFRIIFDQASN
ncbi:MAG: hypothetical protein IJ418_06225 [Clostridia bacterium]|nr:hypothetical protein [Clostridia bacterium]